MLLPTEFALLGLDHELDLSDFGVDLGDGDEQGERQGDVLLNVTVLLLLARRIEMVKVDEVEEQLLVEPRAGSDLDEVVDGDEDLPIDVVEGHVHQSHLRLQRVDESVLLELVDQVVD